MAFALVLVMVVSALSVVITPARAAPASKTPAAVRANVAAATGGVTASALPTRNLKLGWIAMAIGTTNPIHITLDDEYVITYNVYSTLITYDSQYNYKPDLAQKWWVYNSTAYEMYLTPNAYWTDPRNPTDKSHPVTGEDVKWSYETFSQNVGSMDLFTDYVREIDSVWVDPANTFHIRVNFKIPYAPAMETFGTMFILPKYIWSVEGLSYSNPLPIGSGPFMVRPDPAHPDKMLKPPPVLYLDRNPNWHGPAALGWQIFPNTLEIDSYTTSAAMSQDLVLGVIDAVMSPEPTEWVYYLADKPGIIRQSVPHAFVAEVGINLMTPDLRATNPQRFRGTNSPLLQNQVVRVAIQMITNRQKMIDNALLGLGSPADTLVPSVSPWHYDFPNYQSTMPNWLNYSNATIGPYTALEEFPDNTDAPGMQSSTYLARALLMKEGWKFDSAGNPATLTTTPLCKTGGSDCLVFRFYTLSDVNWWKTAADGMVADAAKAGIQLNLALYGTTQMNNQIWWPMDYDIWLWDWMFTPAADPATGILSVETCENLIHGSANDNGFCLRDPVDGHWVYDDLFNASVRETDLGKRRAITDEMQRILYEYGGYSLPFYRKEIYAMNELRWTHWGDWATHPGLPEDVGLNTLIGGQVWPQDHKPPQVADLPAYTGVAGHAVQFSTVATDPNGIGLTYSWDFSDYSPADDLNHDGIWNNDNEATTATASHTYPSPGVYNVTLRVSEDSADPNAEWFTVKTTTATIVAPGTGSPVVSGLAYGPSDPVTTDPQVDFSAAAYDPAGQAMTYAWDFGDGQTSAPSASPLVSHPFGSAGAFTVTVTVQSAGGSAQRSTIVSVAENVAPVVAALQDQQIQEGQLMMATGFATDPNSRDFLTYSWNFGDTTPAGTDNPVTHTYAVQGGSPTSYTLSLTVSDTAPGGSVLLHNTTVSALITVIPRGPDQAPLVTFTAEPPTATTSQEIQFTMTAADPEGDPLRWTVDWNCANEKHCTSIAWSVGTAQTLPNQLQTMTLTHQYAVSGSYLPRVFVDDLDKWNISMTAPVTVTANVAPTLTDLSVAPASPIPNEVVTLSSIAYDDNGDTLNFEWNFGDGVFETGTTAAYGGLIQTTHSFAPAGNYLVILTVNDGYGGVAEKNVTLPVVEQNRAPTVSAISAPHFALVGSPVTISADVGDLNGDTLAFTWNYGDGSSPDTGNTPVPATLTTSHTFTAEGTFNVVLSVDDGNGGTASSNATIIASNAPPVDTTPPVTSAALGGTSGGGGWYTSAVTVTLTATDDLNTVPWTNYTVDGGAETAYTAPFSISADGTHTVEFYSVDFVGNVETTKTTTVQIDRTAPSMTDAETGTTVGSWFTGDVTVTLTPSDDTSGVASASYRIDLGSWQTYTAPFVITTEGQHALDYRAIDVAGWVYTNSATIDIDLNAPVTSANVAGTAGSNGWYISTVQVALTPSDAISGVAATFYRVDGGAWTLYGTTISLTSEGAHTLEYNATDNVGHDETTRSLSVDIDTQAPVTSESITGTVSGLWYMGATVTLSATDGTSGVASTVYQLNGGAWTAYTAPVAIATEGANTFAYRSADAAGNQETAHTSTINVDMTGPTTTVTLTGTAGSNGWYTTSVTVDLTAADGGAGMGTIWYRENGGAWTQFSTAFDVTVQGTTTIDYNATDVLGNDEAMHTQTVKIDTAAPTATLTVPTVDGSSGWFKTVPTLTAGGSDGTSGVATLEYKIDTGAWQTTTGTFTVPEGQHTVTVRVTDSAGHLSSEQTATVKVDVTAPTVTVTPAGTAGNNGWYKSAATVTVVGSDALSGLATLEYQIDTGSWQTTTGTFTVPEGSHAVNVRATDNAGLVSTVSSSTVKVDTTAPALSGVTPTGSLGTGSVTLYWTGTDTGSGIASYSVKVDDAAAQTVTANSTALTLADGTHTIVVTATDVAGNTASQTVTLTVSTAVAPSGGLDTMTIVVIVVVVAAAALGAVWFLMRRKKANPPT